MMWCRGETITVLRPTNVSLRHPGDGVTEVPHTIDNVIINWAGTSEINARGQVEVSDVVLYLPPGSDIRSTDRVKLPDGDRYHVIGKPAPWRSPWSGRRPGTEVKLKGVKGA
ncbi:hypothetical protein [Rhodococcus zopfii]|uniref:hypothetical protein n=1 Tax=Rhodococcus zopfii TaxID=43772 RepID=UPI0035281507